MARTISSLKSCRALSLRLSCIPLTHARHAAKSDREQPEIDRGHNDFEAVFIFSAPVIDWIHAAPCGIFYFHFLCFKNQDLLEQLLLRRSAFSYSLTINVSTPCLLKHAPLQSYLPARTRFYLDQFSKEINLCWAVISVIGGRTHRCKGSAPFVTYFRSQARVLSLRSHSARLQTRPCKR